MKTVVLSVLLLGAGAAVAHPGHGALDIHWHAEDLIWFLVGAVVVIGAVYVIQRKKKP